MFCVLYIVRGYFLFFIGVVICVAYADALNAKIDSVYSSAGSAVADLAGIVAGADVLASQFVDVKSTMQNLQVLMDELKSSYWYVPVGLISPFGGSYANRPPSGWLFCDGAAYSTSGSYANLFGVIGSQYNTAGGNSDPGAGFFRVPDLRARVPMGQSSSVSGSAPVLPAGLSPRTHGSAYGDEGTLLTSSHIPQHAHDLSSHTHSATLSGSMSGSMSGSASVQAQGLTARNNGTGGAYNTYVSASPQTTLSGSASVSGTVSGSVSGTTGGPSNNNSGNYGTADASRVSVPAVQPSLAVSFIVKF